jgi:hypothetical protein
MQTALPPRPDALVEPVAVTAPPKRRGWLIAALAAGTIVVASGIGIAASQADDQANTPVRTSDPIAAPEVPSADVYGQAADLSNQTVTELEAAAASSTPDEMAGHLYTAGDLTEQSANLFVGVDDTLAGYLFSASDHIYASADAVLAGDFTTATSELKAATSDIDAATASIGSGSAGLSV